MPRKRDRRALEFRDAFDLFERAHGKSVDGGVCGRIVHEERIALVGRQNRVALGRLAGLGLPGLLQRRQGNRFDQSDAQSDAGNAAAATVKGQRQAFN